MLRFTKASAQAITAPDAAALTYPSGDWAVGFIIRFDGATADGTDSQYILSNGAFASAGSLNIAYQPTTATTNAGKFTIYRNTDLATAPAIASTNTYSAGTRLFVLQHTAAGALTLRSAPILSAAPTDGSAVVSEGSTTHSGALDGGGALTIGGRTDLIATRFCDQSLSRIFRYDGTLTNTEVAQLAYGMEITELHTPVWYVRGATAGDITDRGSSGTVFTATASAPTGSAEPAFGYAGPTLAAPAYTTAPVVTGTPVVGAIASGVAFTAGVVTGNPTPTKTYQRNLDGANIADNYTFVSGDVGKAFGLVETATNSQGSASSTSNTVAVAAAGTAAVAMAAIEAHRIYQRASGVGAVALSGTYSGTAPATIEYQVYAEDGTTVAVPWTALSGTPANGTWSATASIAQGGMYRLAVRSKDAGGAVLATSPVDTGVFGVGDLIGCIGSSSAAKWFLSDSGTGKTPNAKIRVQTASTWAPFGTVGVAVDLANAFQAAAGVPIGMLNYGVSATTLQLWLTTNYEGLAAFNAGIAAAGGKLAAVISSLGSNDAGGGVVTSQAAHEANLRALAGKVRTTTGQANLPFYISGSNGRTHQNDAQFNMVRAAEVVVGNEANSAYVQTADLEISGDNVHLTPAGFLACINRQKATYIPALYGGTPRTGPRIGSITYEGRVITVNTTPGSGATDLAPITNADRFTASDASGSVTLSAAAKAGTNMLTMTASRDIVAPLRVSYEANARTDTTKPVLDNGTVPLPLIVAISVTASAQAANTTVRLLATYTGVTPPAKPGTIITLPTPLALSFVAAGNATLDLTGGTPFEPQVQPNTIESAKIIRSPSGVVLGLGDAAGNILFPYSAP